MTCVDVSGVAGAGIAVWVDESEAVSIANSDPIMAELEEFERTLGEGPCVDAYLQGETVAEPDLANPAKARWVAFTEQALRIGARAAFGYPLHFASARLGALNLYAGVAGPLTDDQHQDILVVAGIASQVVMASQLTGLPEALFDDLLDVSDNQIQIHQAAGMTSVQLGISISDSLTRLRAHAFAEGKLVSAVAAEVVSRKLRLDP